MQLTEGKAVIFKATPVTNRGRIVHVSELALIFIGADIAEMKQVYWDC